MNPTRQVRVGIRWTIGDVTHSGFQALRLSIWGAWKIFGNQAAYKVCVNTVVVDQAKDRTGQLPAAVEWQSISRADLPEFLRCAPGMAEGTGWKFCPVRLFHGLPELALDNDCILWELPGSIERWLWRGEGAVIAEDVRSHFGRFAPLCGDAPRNSGIRGLAADFPYEQTLRDIASAGGELQTEGDEQGLQVAAIQAAGAPEVVSVEDVSICSPFPPHLPTLGRCGAHFVGLNTKRFPWTVDGRDPAHITRDHWQKLKPLVKERIFRHPTVATHADDGVIAGLT